jgi:NADPH:quinone reductase-like Zn-dependent oxidoreductase
MTVLPIPARTVTYDAHGGPEVLRLERLEVAAPAPGEVRVRVVACGLNPVDAKLRAGRSRMQLPLPVRVGREFSGMVEAMGAGVTDFALGQQVFGSIPQGCASEHLVAPAEAMTAVPNGLTLAQAAGLSLAGQTAWDALESQHLEPGATILVSAAAGGVGGILAQLAVARGIRVIGTASPANHDWLRSRGVEPVAYGEGLAARLAELAPEGITAVFDQAGPETIEAALQLGVPVDRINTIATDASVYGVRSVGRGPVHPPTLDALAALVVAGTIDLPIEAVYPLDEVRAAFEHLERGHLRGKIVLTIP